ncbi:tyrosine-type recombinase/integrase [Ferribacterium limneticum]|uniref:tyrosine-type recombinase/integrase n=1 Tax=Ferribacterium limneticum TaxID=76259 RepID=UPI001CF8FF8D|nr:integrase family protein [Ferribacterium limneticum]UCV23830.1 integrase family protein [Ferribacterium limneticum]
MTKVRLTAARIRDLECPPEKTQVFMRDTDTQGLGVRATKGSKAFIFQSKLKNGSTIRSTIGDIRAWSLDSAKEEARRLQRLIDQGNDPRELEQAKVEAKAEAKRAKEAALLEKENRSRYTLRALCNAYSDHLEAKGKGSARQARSIFKCHVFEAAPDIAEIPAREITSHHAAALVRKVMEQDKSRAAGVLRSYLSAAFNAARKAPFDAKLPSSLIPYGVESNPVEPIATIPVNRGERTLTTEELKTYMAALSEESIADLALRLALFSGGQRMAQLLRAKVSDYDQETETLRLLDKKGKRITPREHLLPLAPMGAAIVEKLLAMAKKKKSDLLFSSNGTTSMVETTPGKRVFSICQVMGCEAFDLRDIRRTCETMLAGMGVSKDVRAQLLSHGLSGVQSAHYDRYEYITEKRNALEAWERRLDDISKGKSSDSNVLSIKRKRPLR